MPAAAVVIAAQNLMPALLERVQADGDVQTFADNEPIQALQAILDHRPPLVVLERTFAATPRGAALINRVKSDPQLSGTEVRVISHTGDYSRQVVKPAAGATTPGAAWTGTGAASESTSDSVATQSPPKTLDWHGTRRAPRFSVRDGVELQLDGNPVVVVNLSVVGAQVVSSTVLRPNQRVRITVPSDDFTLRFRGEIAWAKFELPKPPLKGAQYRAGVEFTDSDTAVIDSLIDRSRNEEIR
jgi:hypothetical protein